MGKEKIRKVFLVGLTILLNFCFFTQSVFAIYTGQALVNRAKGYHGLSYEWGQPPERNDGYGWVFRYDLWDKTSIDCSGLVDVSADLRRHYGCGHLANTPITQGIKWEDLQPGDLIVRGNWNKWDHVRIFIEWKLKNLNIPVDKWEVWVIEATPPQVDKYYYTISQLKNDKHGSYKPRRLIHDVTPPIIKEKGVENEKIYNKPVTVSFEVEDDVYNSDSKNPDPRAYAYEKNEDDKFKERTYSEDGKYIVNFKAIDWAKNEKDKQITFYIDRILPEVESTTHPKR
jgi:hypothetical protein